MWVWDRNCDYSLLSSHNQCDHIYVWNYTQWAKSLSPLITTLCRPKNNQNSHKNCFVAVMKLWLTRLMFDIASRMLIKGKKFGIYSWCLCISAVCEVTHRDVGGEAGDEWGRDGIGDRGVGTLGLFSGCSDDVKSNKGVETGGCSLHHLEQARKSKMLHTGSFLTFIFHLTA